MPESGEITNNDGFDALPESWQSHIKGLRNENASLRVKKNEEVSAKEVEVTSKFETQLAELIQEKSEALEAKTTSEVAALKLSAAIKAFGEERILSLAEILVGEDEDSLIAHGEKLKTTFGLMQSAPPVDRSQGSGSSTPLNSDPLLETLKLKLNI